MSDLRAVFTVLMHGSSSLTYFVVVNPPEVGIEVSQWVSLLTGSRECGLKWLKVFMFPRDGKSV